MVALPTALRADGGPAPGREPARARAHSAPPAPRRTRRAREGAPGGVDVTGLAQLSWANYMDQQTKLMAVDRGFQSKYWANLKILGQPCNFRAR
jgi:hypothetical protein